MKRKRRMKPAVVLAIGLASLIAFAGAARAEVYVGRLIAEDLFEKLKFSGRIAVWPVDATQVRAAGLTTSEAAMLSDNIRIALQHLGAAKGFTFVEREAISKVFQEQQFSHGAKDSDFEKLARQAHADALILINLQRKDPAEIVVSARLVRSTGAAIGQVLATSRAYDVEMVQASVAQPPPETAAPQSAPVASAPRTVMGTPTVWPDTVTPTVPAYSAYTYVPAYTPVPAAPLVQPVPTFFARPQIAFGYRRGWR